MHFALALTLFALSGSIASASADNEFAQLKTELRIEAEQQVGENACHLYIVHHGDTDYTVEERLQGWIDIPLNDQGKRQMEELAQELSALKVNALYTSSLTRAVESAKILEKTLHCSVIVEPDLRGEAHGNLEGMKKHEYEQDPHFKVYKSLPSGERIFMSVGAGGLSKADVARKAIPVIKEICKKHPGKNVVIVTHGGVLKFLNFLLGNYTLSQINEVPHGEMLRIDGDGTNLVVVSK